MIDDTYQYCPRCATPLVQKWVAEAMRPACPACGFVLFLDPKVVTVVAVAHMGRLLLGRRNIEPQRGRWSFCSGYVNRGEGVEAAARREVKEETNLDVQLDGLMGVYSRDGSPHVLVGYRATVVGGIAGLAAQESEVMELAFFSPDELPELAFPGDQQLLSDWLRWRNSDAGF